MSCECRDIIRAGLQEMLPDAESIDGQYELLSGRSYSNYQIRRAGKKKAEDKMILHLYCPHCGMKYGEEAPHDDE